MIDYCEYCDICQGIFVSTKKSQSPIVSVVSRKHNETGNLNGFFEVATSSKSSSLRSSNVDRKG